MIIPLSVDPNKDKELIDWLNSFTNRSASMRIMLMTIKNGGSFSGVKAEDKEDNLDNNFMNSLEGFDSIEDA